MNKLEQIVNLMYQYPSDINEHIPILVKYASESEHITEMGVRWICSTYAFLGGYPKKMISYDMKNPLNWKDNPAIIGRGFNTIEEVEEIAKEFKIDYKFIQANVLDVEIEETDLLFLDTWHSFKQLDAELKKHAFKVKKYIIFHDTTTYATKDETNYEELGPEWVGNGAGIWLAIETFLQENPQWELVERLHNNNGLTVIKRLY